MTKRKGIDIKKLCTPIIDQVSKLDIDAAYRPEVFGALLTQQLLRGEFGVEEQDKVKREKRSKPESLTDRIIVLRDSGFFKQPKSAFEVYSEISKTYPCDRNRVEVGLTRLSGRRKLRRVEKMEADKKVVAYVW